MPSIDDICQFMQQFAPTRLAEEWDNVGLLTGDRSAPCSQIMTCLTVTPESAAEAIERNASLIVAHHPLPFRPLKRLTTDAVPSRLLWDLTRANVAIYSPHTGFDSALEGINQSLATKIGLTETRPLEPIADDPQQLGAARIGTLPKLASIVDFIQSIRKSLNCPLHKAVVGSDKPVCKVAVACGSGGSFLSKAIHAGCDTFVTGEATFHGCLEAKAAGVNLVLLGHFASERFAVEMLADRLAEQFPDSQVWASEKESDPISWF